MNWRLNLRLIPASFIVYSFIICLPFGAAGESKADGGPETSAPTQTNQPSESERLFYQGLADSCEIEMNSNAKTRGLLKDLDGQIGVGKFSACAKSLFSNCKENLSEVRKLVAEKAIFISNRDEKPIFPWTRGQQSLYLDLTVTKVCSGAISLKTLKSVDGIFFSNTKCTGDEFLVALPRFNKLGIQHFDGTSTCSFGFNGAGTVGKKSAKYIIINGGTRTLSMIKPDGKILNNLDESLVHEFTHRKEDADPEFARAAAQFTKIRFAKVQSQYNSMAIEFDNNRHKINDQIKGDASLSDEQKTIRLHEELDELSSTYRGRLLQMKAPLRMGLGSDNAVQWEDAKGEPSSFQMGSGLTFANGKFAAQGNNGTLLDDYLLSDRGEYLAGARALYRYDRNSAEKMFTKPELDWLEKHQ